MGASARTVNTLPFRGLERTIGDGPTKAYTEGRAAAEGTLLDSGGMMPIEAASSIVSLTGGAIATTDGSFVEGKELVGGSSVHEVADRAEANPKDGSTCG